MNCAPAYYPLIYNWSMYRLLDYKPFGDTKHTSGLKGSIKNLQINIISNKAKLN